MAQENLSGGRGLIAGPVSTRQIPLAADTYFLGMRLEYKASGSAVTTGTGNGVASAISGGPKVKPGVWTLTFTAALICDLSDPDGNVVAVGLTVPDGSAETFKINGLTFTLTDGGTAWVATDTIAMTIVSAGEYSILAEGTLAALYNGTDGRILSGSGVDDCIMGGEIARSGFKDDAGAAVVLTLGDIAAYQDAGFHVKEN